ncbi:MAG: dienelactone hydrolase family protein, partial [Anaerolineae bacterium]|nr:dienelactone hydrolase family protein [Anaerolineae bacterium]
SIVADDGKPIPAYWSHPDTGGRFPAVAILHDWWGITAVERRLAHLFAQLGYYVIIPDLFDGAQANTPEEAAKLVEAHSARAYSRVDTALYVLENHIRTDGHTAAIGLGMGGTLAFEAALVRADLEAAVACYGFPQRFLGRFGSARTPILALYGSDEPFVAPDMIDALRRELADSPLGHEVVILDGARRDFLNEHLVPDDTRQPGSVAWDKMLTFLEKHRIVPANRHDEPRD